MGTDAGAESGRFRIPLDDRDFLAGVRIRDDHRVSIALLEPFMRGLADIRERGRRIGGLQRFAIAISYVKYNIASCFRIIYIMGNMMALTPEIC